MAELRDESTLLRTLTTTITWWVRSRRFRIVTPGEKLNPAGLGEPAKSVVRMARDQTREASMIHARTDVIATIVLAHYEAA
jgi:hypothetical protein